MNEGDAHEMHNMLDVDNKEDMDNTDQRYIHSLYDYDRRYKGQKTNTIVEELKTLEIELLKREEKSEKKEDSGGIVL